MCHVFQSTLPLRGATFLDELHAIKDRFQSTLPLRGATQTAKSYTANLPISIHAPLAGSDFLNYRTIARSPYFNPRSPCGERPIFAIDPSKYILFQSTLPLRGATVS